MKKRGATRCIDNIFSMITLFATHTKVSSKMVAETLNISIRSAQRYILDISAHMGVIENNDGTYSYLNLAKIDTNFFKNGEKILLNTLIDHGKSIIPKEKHESLERLKKLLMLDTAKNRSCVINENALDFNTIKNQTAVIEDAIKHASLISFRYSKTNTTYNVSPFKTISNNGFWYLFAGYDNKERLFRIDYISDIKIEPGTAYAITANFNERLDNATSIWAISGESYNVEILLDDIIKDYFLKRDVFEETKIVSENPCIIKVKIHNEMELFEKLAKYTPHYEILTTPERNYFIDILKESLQKHEKN